MATMKPLLIEVGTEELPIQALPELARALFEGVVAGLRRRGLEVADEVDGLTARPLYTPRRLAVLLPAVSTEQPRSEEPVLGPAVSIARDADGNPTPALLGFAKKAGVDVSELVEIPHNQGPRLGFMRRVGGVATAALLPEVIEEAVRAIPIPKPMRWGDGPHAFARPVHWLLVLLGEQVVDCSLFDVRSDRMSRGHRFHHDKPVWVGHAADYVDALAAVKVMVDPEARREAIRAQVEAAAADAGGTARIDAGNLEAVNNLVEWPRAIACRFEAGFLDVPAEALVSTMEANQKFFPVLDADGALTPDFIGVANIESRDERVVAQGYERVIRPRFADAKFFYEADLRQGLEAMNAGLGGVTYQQKLGSLADKVARVCELAESVATGAGVDPAMARRAAELSKADLQSLLVNEFPELQGIAGRYYAGAAGEAAEVAAAIDQAYMPRFAGDAVAPSPLGRVLAVAERVDTVAGGFAAGLKPTGNKDPFALRRNALGLARTLIEGDLALPLAPLVRQALAQLPPDAAADDRIDALVEEVVDFVFDRLRGYFADRGVPAEQFDAVAAARPASLHDFSARLQAIAEFARLPEAEALAAANKRIRNILRKAEDEIPQKVSRARLQEEAEIALAESVEAAVRETDGPLAAGDYVAVLKRLAWLREPVDRFFDQVMVMAEDPAIRENRLALLKRLADRFAAVGAVERLSQA
ncbi:MAG: glycine--tRNA ligase subunit beta [Lysobacteraceae bacterium]